MAAFFFLKVITLLSTFCLFYLSCIYCIDQTAAINCHEAQNCSSCISSENICKWCTDDDLPQNRSRCQVFSSECRSQFDPRGQQKTNAQDNLEFSDDQVKPIQMKPQKTRVKARVGSTADILIEFKQAQKIKISNMYHVLKDIIDINKRKQIASQTGGNDSLGDMAAKAYMQISTSMELVVEKKPDNVDIEIASTCGQASEAPLVLTSTCPFQGDAILQFHLRLKLLKCTKPGKNTEHIIRIGLLTKNEAVEIAFTEICQCDCELKEEANSSKCSSTTNETYSCEICTTCIGARAECACDPDKSFDPKNPNAQCIKKEITGPISLSNGNVIKSHNIFQLIIGNILLFLILKLTNC